MNQYSAEIGPVTLVVQATTEDEAIELMLDNVKATREEVIKAMRAIDREVKG